MVQRIRQILDTTRWNLRRFDISKRTEIPELITLRSLLIRFLNASYIHLRGLLNTFYVLDRTEPWRKPTISSPRLLQNNFSLIHSRWNHLEPLSSITAKSIPTPHSRAAYVRVTVVRTVGARSYLVHAGAPALLSIVSVLIFVSFASKSVRTARPSSHSFVLFLFRSSIEILGKTLRTLSPLCVRVDHFQKSLW